MALNNEILRLALIVVAALAVVWVLNKMGHNVDHPMADAILMKKEGMENGEEEEEIMEEPVPVVRARDPGPMVGAGFDGLSAEELKHACFPTDRELTADDLMPRNEYAAWADVHPHGVGVLQDKNFLHAGHHIGINTVGQSLRNANQSFRSEPANPQVQVSPWLQTTIGSDQLRRPMEIGSHY